MFDAGLDCRLTKQESLDAAWKEPSLKILRAAVPFIGRETGWLAGRMGCDSCCKTICTGLWLLVVQWLSNWRVALSSNYTSRLWNLHSNLKKLVIGNDDYKTSGFPRKPHVLLIPAGNLPSFANQSAL